MAYTCEEVFLRACALVDSVTNAGAVDSNITADYRGRALALIDICQKELVLLADTRSIYKIARSRIDNMLGSGSYYNVRTYKADEDYEIEASNDAYGSVKGYYFECDGSSGTVYIEDYNGSWNVLDTITLANTGIGFNSYSGSVTPTSNATKSRIRFSGNYLYRYVNVALYNYNYATIPVYRSWIPQELPTDCYRIDKVTIEYPHNAYTTYSAYKTSWEDNRKTLYVSHDFEGTLNIHYKPIPAKPTAFTDNVAVDDVASQGIVYYLAHHFILTEQNDMLANRYYNAYERVRNSIAYKQPEGENVMIDYYDSDLGGGDRDGTDNRYH